MILLPHGIIKAISSLYDKTISRTKILEIVLSVGLEEKDLSIMVENFSSGMKQKLNFALMLILSPPVILLDEPFNALDYNTQKTFHHILKRLKNEGHTIIFTSHLIDTILDLADHLLLLNNSTFLEERKTSGMSRKDLEDFVLDN